MVLKTTDNYDDATAYMHRQRRLTPPIYNAARVLEEPVPNINQPIVNAVSDAIEEALDETIDTRGPIVIAPNTAEEPIIFAEEPTILMDNIDHNGTIDPLAIKEERVFEVINDLHDVNDELGDLVGFHHEKLDDDISVYYEDIKLFKPKTDEEEIKRNDAFSGTIPYRQYVRNTTTII